MVEKFGPLGEGFVQRGASADGEPIGATSITITLRLQPTPGGLALNVQVEPAETFPDTVIDACLRAARHLERTLTGAEIVKALAQQAKQADALRRNLGMIRGRG